jgi:lipopolysaccharide transport system ATP-binding protein
VQEGEVVGIIGRNGAGKSTLLKILSRITEPTTGKVRIRGRVASLLEVGTGFHQELTGRENIYLNGAILGMSRRELKGKFDEIVAFSEVEKFLDTPVKRYSSGMYVRLAFAVAAHLEPEILVVDEVLAVGDSAFQRKCLDKMHDVGQHGRTVFFVSHNMPAITRLCGRAIMLSQGQLVADGTPQQVVGTYLTSGLGTTAHREWPLEEAPGNEFARLRAVRIINESGTVTEALDIRRPIGIEIEFDVINSGKVLVPNFTITNEEGVCICHPHDWQADWRRKPRPVGRHRRISWIPGDFMAEGTFIVDIALSSYDPIVVHFHERHAVAFQVIDGRSGDSARGDYAGHLPGVVRPVLQWTDGAVDSNGSHAQAN